MGKPVVKAYRVKYSAYIPVEKTWVTHKILLKSLIETWNRQGYKIYKYKLTNKDNIHNSKVKLQEVNHGYCHYGVQTGELIWNSTL